MNVVLRIMLVLAVLACAGATTLSVNQATRALYQAVDVAQEAPSPKIEINVVCVVKVPEIPDDASPGDLFMWAPECSQVTPDDELPEL